MSWVHHITPEKLSDCANKGNIVKMSSWLETWEKKESGDSIKNAILLHGLSGTGKSLYARLLLKEHGYNDVLYFSTSDIRTYNRLTKRINKFIKNFTFLDFTGVTVKRAIIFDELEGVGTSDKGCIKKIIELLYPRKTKTKQKMNSIIRYKVPIICITNNINDPRSNKIKKYCNLINFPLPDKKIITHLLKSYKQYTKKTLINPDLCYKISKKYHFDYNMLIRFFKEIEIYKSKTGKNCITETNIKDFKYLTSSEDVIHARYLNSDMYNLSRKILTEPVTYKECFDFFNAFPSILQFIVYDNINTYYSKEGKIDEIIDNLDFLSISCIMDKSIHDEQNWVLYDYTSVMYLKKANDICSTIKLPIENIDFSSILNKNSKTLYTHKIIKELLKRIKVNSYDLTLTGSIIVEMFLRLKQDNSTLEWFKQTDIIGSIDKFVKFNLFEPEYKITNKYKKSIIKIL
tara:strand:+ start:385 stop:1764 length:1380 start_codon:yes stop_codon:yes gene_type:complete